MIGLQSIRIATALVIACCIVLIGHASAELPHAVVPSPGTRLAGDLASTPPMGWNDWNAFGCDVSAELVEQTADAMVANGLAAAGYRFVNIDDCWMAHERDLRTGRLVPDPAKFPRGIAAVADYAHARGLKLGIYEDAGTATCAGYPGSLGHERLDARTFAEWGVDYLKYDNCNHADSKSTGQYVHRYVAMRDALAATGRPIVYSLCEWGVNEPWTWGRGVGHSWRTTTDITDSYASMLAIFRANVRLSAFAQPGGWNDPDMLEIGNGGMSAIEQRAEFSLWAAMAAPLISGTDLRTISRADLAIYSNREVIAVDQDRLGRQAVPIANNDGPAGSDGLWVLSKPLAGGGRAVVLFNSTNSQATIDTTTSRIGLGSAPGFAIRDLWSAQELTTTGPISAVVPAHGVVMYRVTR